MDKEELELYEYELSDGSSGQTAAHSVLEVLKKFQGRDGVSVQEVSLTEPRQDFHLFEGLASGNKKGDSN